MIKFYFWLPFMYVLTNICASLRDELKLLSGVINVMPQMLFVDIKWKIMDDNDLWHSLRYNDGDDGCDE